MAKTAVGIMQEMKGEVTMAQSSSAAVYDIEDFTFDEELFARDPYFDRATQAELVRRARNMDAGINCSEHELIEVD